MHHLLSPEFWALGIAEHIRNLVLFSLAALAVKMGFPRLPLAHLDGVTVVIVRSMAVVLVALSATGQSPMWGRIWLDLPMGACIAGVFYASTAFGPGIRLAALSPIATMTYAATVYVSLGMPVTQVAYGIMVCYSIFMVISVNVLMVAILVSTIRFGVPEDRLRVACEWPTTKL